MVIDSDLAALQEVRTKIDQAYKAWQSYRNFPQDKIDAIVEACAAVARENAQYLADLAVEDTGYGNARDKYFKNMLSADILPRSMRGLKTVGILKECKERQIVDIGVPMGVVAAILPTTNPTSTAIYKILICLKSGNGIVCSPHPRARRCSCETAALMAQAAERAGAPEGIVQCITTATIETTNELMHHKRTAAILSTGGSGIVRAAYSSGKPAFGVGPGNVPVIVDKSADISDAVAKVVAGKSFDYGTLCSSEQALIAEEGIRDQVLAALKTSKAYTCSAAEGEALARVLLVPPKWSVSAECVGQAPGKIAKMAGFTVPGDTSILAVHVAGVGKEYPLSAEKLSPVLSLFFVKDFEACLQTAEAVLRFGGLGHTCGIHAKDDARVREFASRMPAMRVLCNSSTPQGSVGITTNLQPAMTLGCGAIAGNITGDNIGPKHLINVKRLAYAVRNADEAFETKASGPRSMSTVDKVDRQTVVSAVERYLTQRGLGPLAKKNAPSVVETVVDKFLASKQGVPSAAKGCGCGSNTGATCSCTASLPLTAAPAPETPKEPAITIVNFVCEDDVRTAIQKNKKIYIGPKTIVTPSARDLASAHDTLVVAKRS